MELEQEGSVVVYSGQEYLELVKSAKAPERWDATHRGRQAISRGHRTRQDAAEAARKLRSAGTYARHQEALRALEEDEKRQREVAMQSRKIREEENFARLMARCSEAMDASRELDTFLSRHEQTEHSRRARRHGEWNDKVFSPIKNRITSNLTEESFLSRKEARKRMHEDYLRACDHPNGVFLHVPGPTPKEINMRYSTKKIEDPLKADLEKDSIEKGLVEALSDGKANDKRRARSLIDPTDYLKVTPTRRKVVHGPPSHERILPNDYTETTGDNDVARCEMFTCRKRLFYAEDDRDILTDGSLAARRCGSCECVHKCAVVSPEKRPADDGHAQP